MILVQGFMTLMDIPFLVLALPLFILTPYRSKILFAEFSTEQADSWNLTILKYWLYFV